ncbi:MAG: hypothetical protein ACYSTY_05925 [Planctomycetota bacterium]
MATDAILGAGFEQGGVGCRGVGGCGGVADRGQVAAPIADVGDDS